MKVIALIYAQGSSKGLPGKNIPPLAGPLITWVMEQAKAVKRISRVIVSTDSKEIVAAARRVGAKIPSLRPAELAHDKSPEWLVLHQALNYLKEFDGRYPDDSITRHQGRLEGL